MTPPNILPNDTTAYREILRLQSERDDALADRDSYRLLSHVTLTALHELSQRHRQQTQRLRALLDERRQRPRAA